MREGKKAFAIAGMVLGIVACIIPWWGLPGGIIALVCAITGLVLSIVAKKSYDEIGTKNGMATAGLILSIIGIVLAIIGLIACGICVSSIGSVANQLESQGWTISTEAIDLGSV